MQHSSCETDDFEDLQEAASAWDQEYAQLSAGAFRGSFELAEIGSTQVMREKWRRRIRYRGIGVPNGYDFAMPLGSADPADWLGSPVGPASVFMQSPDQEGQLITGESWDSIVLSFSKDEVQPILFALSGGHDLTHKLHGNIALNQENADRIKRAGLDLLHKAITCSADNHTLYAAQADQFKKMFLWEMVEALSTTEAQYLPSKRASIVQQATDLVFANPSEIIGLTEICTHLEISLRALHYAFQDVAGMSPATWLRRIRLNQVHKALKQASPQVTRIKRVAAEHGFLHLGHFSNQYQLFFGSLPSQTLRLN